MKYTQNFDTLNIQFPITLLNSFAEEYFKTMETPGGIQIQQLGTRDLKGIHGLNLIRVNKVAKEVVLGLSAKILGCDYPKMLNAETIPIALEKVQATGLLSFDTQVVMATAETLLIHTAKDLSLSQNVAIYNRIWSKLHVSDKYTISEFYNENSLIFTKNVKTPKAKERAKLYGKAHELELPKNKLFRESLVTSDLESIRNYFRDKVRFEIELKTKTKIRQYYGLTVKQPVLLSTVLASNKNPLSTMFERITADMAAHPEATEIRLFHSTLTDKEKDIMGRCKLFDLDLEQVKADYYATYPKRLATARDKFKKAKELVSRFQAQQGNLGHKDFQLLNELRQQIAA